MKVMVRMPLRAVGVDRRDARLCDGRCGWASSTGSCLLMLRFRQGIVRRKWDAKAGKWRRTRYCVENQEGKG